MDRTDVVLPAELKTPRAAAVAGIIFSCLLGTALVLVRVSVPEDPKDAGAWLTDPGRRGAVALALNLVPFAGIAFLWFLGVVRDRVGEREDRFFATVFLGSGLLFVAMLFVGAAVAAGLLRDPAVEGGTLPSPEAWGLARRTAFTVLNVYGIRMGAVFIMTTTTIALRSGVIRRWLALVGYAVGVVLLVGSHLSTWANILLPVWVLVLSVTLLLRGGTGGRTDAPSEG